MTQRDQPREYTLPLKIDGIVEKNEEEIRKRLRTSDRACPLYGYIIEQDSEEIPKGLEGRCSVNHPHMMSSDRPIELHVCGCGALRDPVCYLKENQEKVGQRRYHRSGPRIVVEEKTACPIYVRALEVLVKLGEDKPTEVVRYVSNCGGCSHTYERDIPPHMRNGW